MSHRTRRGLKPGLSACLVLASAHPALCEEFSLMIGSPVASQSFQAKTAAFVFRTKGCSEPETAQVSVAAEGLVNGARRSVRPVKANALPTPGVYAVFREWPAEGAWVMNITGHCGAAVAGALVPIGPKGFLRESSKFFPHAATEAEVEASLKSLANSPGRK